MDSNKEKESSVEQGGEESSVQLPIISIHGEKSPSISSQFSRQSSGGRKLLREDAMDDKEDEPDVDPKSTVIKRRMTMPASTSDFRRTLSEEAKYV